MEKDQIESKKIDFRIQVFTISSRNNFLYILDEEKREQFLAKIEK